MCGEHDLPTAYMRAVAGSSPHVRGARVTTLMDVPASGIIPACAGSTVVAGATWGIGGDHPRMCGEHTSKIA